MNWLSKEKLVVVEKYYEFTLVQQQLVSLGSSGLSR